MCNTEPQKGSSGWERLSAVFRKAFRHVPDRRQLEPAPKEFLDWLQHTFVGVMAGMLLYGVRQSRYNRELGPVVVPEGLPTKLHIANYIATEKSRRLSMLLNETVRGGLHLGGAIGLFVGARELLAVYRDVQDAANTVSAATLTGFFYGMLVKGKLPTRLRSAGLMAALGGAAGYPVALLHDAVAGGAAQAPEASPAPPAPAAEQPRDQVDAMVAAMLASVGEHSNGAAQPAQKQQRSWLPWNKQNTD